MADNRIRILLEAVDKISGPVGKIQDRFDTLGKSKGFKSFAQGIGIGAGMAAWNLVGDAASRAVEFIGDSIKAASDQREAMALNDQVFRSSADNIDKWSSGTARALGLSKTAAINFSAQFGNSLKAAGLSGDDLAAKAIELTKRAADLGSAFNASGEDVSTAIRSGLVGESEPMRRFGVLLSEAKVKAKGMAMGLADANGELTDGAKVLARYQLILDESSDSAGMFGRDLGSMADQQKRLNALAEDTSAKFGEVLLPIVVEFQSTIIKALDNTSISMADMEAAAAKGSQAAQAHLNALAATADDVSAQVTTSNNMTGMAFNDMHDAVAQSTKDSSQATDDFMAKVKDMAGRAKIDTRSVEDYFSDMADAIQSDADDLIDKAFDPIIAKNDLAARNAEIDANRRIIASGKATKAEKRDAADAIDSAMRDTAQLLVTLAKAGETNSQTYRGGIKRLKEYIKTATGPTKRYLQDVYDGIRDVERVGARIPINLYISAKGFSTHPGGHGKLEWAEGGWVDAPKGQPVVGVVHGGEYVIPADVASDMKSGVSLASSSVGPAMGGGMTFVYSPTYSTASAVEAQRFMRAIVPELTREMRRQSIV